MGSWAFVNIPALLALQTCIFAVLKSVPSSPSVLQAWVVLAQQRSQGMPTRPPCSENDGWWLLCPQTWRCRTSWEMPFVVPPGWLFIMAGESAGKEVLENQAALVWADMEVSGIP